MGSTRKLVTVSTDSLSSTLRTEPGAPFSGRIFLFPGATGPSPGALSPWPTRAFFLSASPLDPWYPKKKDVRRAPRPAGEAACGLPRRLGGTESSCGDYH